METEVRKKKLRPYVVAQYECPCCSTSQIRAVRNKEGVLVFERSEINTMGETVFTKDSAIAQDASRKIFALERVIELLEGKLNDE